MLWCLAVLLGGVYMHTIRPACLPCSVVMMGTASAIFNPAVLFAWAILGRTSWKNWIVLSLCQVRSCIHICIYPPPASGPLGQAGPGRIHLFIEEQLIIS